VLGLGTPFRRRRSALGVWDGWQGPLTDLPTAAIDVETSGLDPAGDRVLEIAIVADRRLILESLVRPPDGRVGEGPHGLTAQMLAGAPTFSDLVPTILRALEGRLVVGHNVAFDLGFLHAETSRLGLGLPPLPHVCTVRLAALLDLNHPTRRLSWACERYGISLERPHHAADDALAAMGLFEEYAAVATARSVGLAELAMADPADATVRSWRHPPLRCDPGVRRAA
jgi:DNA polymerase-3 subunit epsilon